MRGNHGTQLPAIHVYYSPLLNDPSLFQQLRYGIEEEGVPSQIEAHADKSAVELGYLAAQNSSLDVGIGVGEDYQVALHYTKLPPDKPLFQINLKKEAEKLRPLGANAARLVKGIPFKDLKDCSVQPVMVREPAGKPLLQEEEIASIVARVLSMMKETEQKRG